MESILASTEDHLVSNLAYKLPQNSASYVTSKDQSTFSHKVETYIRRSMASA